MEFSKAKRIVIKLGTSSVVNSTGSIDRARLSNLTSTIKTLWKQKKEITLVSSGAVQLGKNRLQLSKNLSLQEKQACAAIGQSLLMQIYQELFEDGGPIVAQLLLTAHELSNRTTYLNLRNTFENLFANRVIPIVNENDSVSTFELKGSYADKSFGDNDKLSALVAAKLSADLLIILTDVDGIYEADPEINKQAKKIISFQSLQELNTIQKSESSSGLGRGGMISKIEAARIASISGVPMVVANGQEKDIISKIMAANWGDLKKELPGTIILPQAPLSKRKQWIGFSSEVEGVIAINHGAKRAMIEANSSLLAVGVIGHDGTFEQGQVVSIQDEEGQEIGRGISRYNHLELHKIKGLREQKITELLGSGKNKCSEVVHRDDLVIFEETLNE